MDGASGKINQIINNSNNSKTIAQLRLKKRTKRRCVLVDLHASSSSISPASESHVRICQSPSSVHPASSSCSESKPTKKCREKTSIENSFNRIQCIENGADIIII